MAVTVKHACERFILHIRPVTNNIEIRPGISSQVNVFHELKVLVPVSRMNPDGVHLLRCIDLIGIVRLSRPTAVLGVQVGG